MRKVYCDFCGNHMLNISKRKLIHLDDIEIRLFGQDAGLSLDTLITDYFQNQLDLCDDCQNKFCFEIDEIVNDFKNTETEQKESKC